MERHFDPWQQQAIEISSGRHLVLAPPGCGKTDILTERVVHAHTHGIPYADMLCLTFTNRAAKGMAQRIADRTSAPLPDDLFVGNIHRFCSQMLFTEGVVNHNSTIIDEIDAANIIQEELCPQFNTKVRTSELLRTQHGLRQMAMGMRGDLILHADLFHTGLMSKLCDVLGLPFNEENLAHIYTHIESLTSRYQVLSELPAANLMVLANSYERYKQDHDLLDYDDLLLLAYQHLSQPQSTTRFSWIEVDEVQDLNSLQLAIIDLLATPEATIVYLGDEQQAIFSFIGAKLETLQALKQRCEGHVHYLHNNYRSPAYLLDLQNDYASLNLGIPPDALPTTDNHTPPQPGDLCLIDLADGTLESYYAARFAQRYGTSSSSKVAILVSTNREADSISEAMTNLGIAHFKISGTDLFSLPAVKLLIAHLCVVADENTSFAWARLFWSLGLLPTYTAARHLMHSLQRVALLPSDFLLHPDSSYLQAFSHAYDTETLVIFDTETTGLDPTTDDIIQIAAIKVHRGQPIGQSFNIILSTSRPIPAEVGGHPNPMLDLYHNSHRYSPAEGLRRFLDFCDGLPLVGHNAAFDYSILDHNLRRHCPDLILADHCPRCFDTLKYIRLIRPRLRRYKLGYLLDTLHLEGANSHRADDDILATLALLRFCHTAASPLIAQQRLFLADNRQLIADFRSRYADLYLHAYHQQQGSITSELQFAYQRLLASGLISPIDKWEHLIHYLDTDLIRSDRYPTLHQQLARYATDLTTSKEADLCGGSLQEQYIISTIHKAKGLEFDAVVIPRATDDNYPGPRSWTEHQIQEDARCLFVAISRSRRCLCILYHSRLSSSAHSLSPFLKKVQRHFTLYRRTPDGKIRPA
ncbi:MAG: UvrD-helicase domain-containing protein [Bacteroidales bacterium]|nr:UvrD-helicase domain-containing protein [Bacteroidales bacterium]